VEQALEVFAAIHFLIVGLSHVALCFLLPATQMRTLGRVSPERAWELVVPGVAYVALGGMLSYSILTS
jgi:hypothetical protein